MIRSLFLIVILWATSYASHGQDFFLGSELGWSSVKIAEEHFDMPSLLLRVGGRLENGIGVEFLASSGLTEDEEVEVDLGIQHHESLYATYTGNIDRTAEITVALGYGRTELDANLRNSGLPGGQVVHGAGYAVKLEEKTRSWPGFSWSGGYYSVIDADDITIRNFTFGIQYEW